jgi:hypothetical protein
LIGNQPYSVARIDFVDKSARCGVSCRNDAGTSFVDARGEAGGRHRALIVVLCESGVVDSRDYAP